MNESDLNGYNEYIKGVSKLPEGPKRGQFLIKSLIKELSKESILPMERNRDGSLEAIKGMHYTVR